MFSRKALALCAMSLAGLAWLRADAPPANYPAWWYDGVVAGTSIVSSSGTYLAADNYAPVNLGQLKWVATRAKAYLDVKLTGGSQLDLTTFFPVMPVSTDPGYGAAVAANYAPANLGQLKAITQLFYDRLHVAGYDTNAYLKTQGYPSTWTSLYPWPAGGDVNLNYGPANLGQVKLVFGFDLSTYTPPGGGTGGAGNDNGATLAGDDNDLGAHPAAVVTGLTDSAGNPIAAVVKLPDGAGAPVTGSAADALQVYTPFVQNR